MAVLALLMSLLALVGAVIALRRTVRMGSNRQPADGLQQLPALPHELRAGLDTALRHVSVVRYDAYVDVTGRQSFTAAILDDNGDGLVITSLHSRTESRTQIKGIVDGRAHGLSPEEEQAVAYATGEKEQPR